MDHSTTAEQHNQSVTHSPNVWNTKTEESSPGDAFISQRCKNWIANHINDQKSSVWDAGFFVRQFQIVLIMSFWSNQNERGTK
jgi:hypothetical protein